MSIIVILVTTPTMVEARLIAKKLVDTGLVACANITSVESVFKWEREMNQIKEYLLFMKARKDKFKAIEKTVKKFHSYKNPEIIALPVITGSKEYLDWVSKST